MHIDCARMNFIIVTKDFAGLGFAMKLQSEGHAVLVATNPDPDDLAGEATRCCLHACGDGIVPKEPLAELMTRREELREHYWIWDFNHSVEENETLRAEGFKLMGGGRFADSMEHDRKACLDFTSGFGLDAPPSFSFSSREKARAFCEKNRGTAYVYKPDEGANFETFLPESEDPAEANEELRAHLNTLETDRTFILQERKEVWRPTWKFGLPKASPYLRSWASSANAAVQAIWANSWDARWISPSQFRSTPKPCRNRSVSLPPHTKR